MPKKVIVITACTKVPTDVPQNLESVVDWVSLLYRFYASNLENSGNFTSKIRQNAVKTT